MGHVKYILVLSILFSLGCECTQVDCPAGPIATFEFKKDGVSIFKSPEVLTSDDIVLLNGNKESHKPSLNDEALSMILTENSNYTLLVEGHDSIFISPQVELEGKVECCENFKIESISVNGKEICTTDCDTTLVVDL